jgi:uncharacterized protein YfdQ (DUF2303 family)
MPIDTSRTTPTSAELRSFETQNIAQTLAEVLPKASIVLQPTNLPDLFVLATPKGHQLQEIDLERLGTAPRRAKLQPAMQNHGSFLAYVQRHATDRTVVWCDFDPQSYRLSFAAVFDDLGLKSQPGWRGHCAAYQPNHSAEWKVWTGSDGQRQAMSQLDFAMFLERNETDIVNGDGLPTSLQMMQMATAFEANSDKRVKSVVKIQGGGSRLDFVDDNNAETEDNMRLFEKFAIGIPVFWAGPGYRIGARLRYRHGSGKVSFWYDLTRPDRVHEAAALELIATVRDGLPEGVPLLMGSAKG